MPPEHGFMTLGHILHNVDLRAAFDRLRAATAEADTAEPEPEAALCDRCRGSGLLRRDVAALHPDFGKPIECPCGLVAARRSLRIWDAAQIPPKFRPYTLDSYTDVSGRYGLVSNLRDWLSGDRWLLLTGDIGVGKSGLAAALLTEWLRSGGAGLYISMPMFFSRIRATYRDNGDQIDELDVLGAVIGVPLLVLDDLGIVSLSEWGREKLYTLIDERAGEGRRTIITSNLRVTDGSFEAYVGARIWDRCRGMADVVNITGESLRGRPVPGED